MIGARLGPYEITVKLGEGGMGEVYRATDSKLRREVAIKVLPAAFTADRERLARFEREAQLLAQLNHSNVAHVYGLEASGDAHALIMELVDGPTLADRLAQGALPLEEALAIAHQIAEALEAAHEKGIVHRDLKPQNIKVRADGMVKVLDFGLAKAMEPSGSAASAADLARSPTLIQSPTLTAAGTQLGVILGTAGYMSPEQARGLGVDKRADVWAFGVVLYEMLTGRSLFTAETVSDTLAGVLKNEIPIEQLPASTPPAIRTLLRRCLERNPKNRLHDIADARLFLDDVHSERVDRVATESVVAPRAPLWRRGVPWALAAAALLLAGALAWREALHSKAPAANRLHAYLVPPEAMAFRLDGDDAAPPVVSPDGTRVAYGVAGDGDRLWLDSLSTGATQSLPATERAKFPFWSHDGRSIGFFADGKLKRIDLDSGEVTALAPAPDGRGGAWGRGGMIVYAPTFRTGLFKVAAGGGKAEPLTTVEAPRHTTHRWPSFLPDGGHVVYLAANHADPLGGETEVRIASLADGRSAPLMRSESNALFVPGWLLTVRGGSLLALPFDDTARRVTGEPLRVAERVQYDSGVWRGVVSASDNGVLAYRTASALPGGQLTWHDRSGRVLDTVGTTERATNLHISPDDRRASITLGDPNGDAWIYDLDRGMNMKTRITVNAQVNGAAVWSPDGSRIALRDRTASDSVAGIALHLVDGGGADRDLVRGLETRSEATDWSPDGRYLLLDWGEYEATDIWMMPLAAPEKRAPFVATPFNERNGRFSPDGRWVAYTSRESGRDEVYVAAFPAGRPKVRISASGGSLPRWRGDGRELFYLSADKKIAAAQVRAGVDRLEAGDVLPLFAVELYQQSSGYYPYDVSRDGQRFLVVDLVATQRPRVVLLANWQSGLGR
jgi:Tol biopolymer transport system component